MSADLMNQDGSQGKDAIFRCRAVEIWDAILGRDDRLVAKLTSAVEKLDVSFAAIIGTPCRR